MLEYLGEVTVAPITITVRDIPSEVFLSKIDGMPKDCAVNCNHLRTVSKSKIGSLMTSVYDVGWAICVALDIYIAVANKGLLAGIHIENNPQD